MDSGNFSNENYTTTPLKSDGSSNNSTRRAPSDRNSSNQYKTPVRCNESIVKRGKLQRTNSYKGNVIKKMPIYSPTPDSTGHVKNPFEHARLLKERLSQPFCSPSLFEKIMSPVKDDQFNWNIEDISVLRPAPINENPLQDFDSWFSPATESEAQQAIDKFFSSQIVNMESPIDMRHSRFKPDTPVKIPKGTTDTWSQTVLSFPPNLPPEIEKILSSYCTFNENQFNQDDEDDLDSSNSSISRKKLSFESAQVDVDSLCITPVQTNYKCSKQTVASTPITTVLTSPEMSPIVMSKVQDSPMDISMSYRSKTRLSLTSDVDMNEKENVQMSWHRQASMAFHQCDQSTDSAFSSV